MFESSNSARNRGGDGDRDRHAGRDDRPRTRAALTALLDAAMRATGATGGMAGLLVGGRILFREYREAGASAARPVEFVVPAGDARKDRIVTVPGGPMAGPRQRASGKGADGRDGLPMIHGSLRAPILTPRGRLLGCLELHNKRDRSPFAREDLRIVKDLIGVGALALVSAAELDRDPPPVRGSNRLRFEPGEMFETIDQPAMVLDARGVVVAANRAMCKLQGQSLTRIRGQHCREIYGGGEEPFPSCPTECEHGRNLDGASHWEAELNGRSIIVSCSPVRDEAGRIQHAFHLATDITERKRIEQELALLKDRAHSYLQIAAVMIVAIDASQRVTVVNQKACEILGYPKSSILGRNWFDAFIPEGERSRVKGAFAALLRGEIELAQYHENPVLTRGGAERIIAWHNTTLHDAAGAISGTLSSGTDITDRRRADEDLRALNETLEHRVAERTALAETQARQLRMLARELTQAEMHERERVARVLHDNFQQLLVAARLHVEMLLRGDAGPRQRHQLDKVNDILQESIRECNSLAVELCPPVLYDLGLAAGLEWLGERMRALHGLRVRVETCPDAEPEDVDLRAFLFEAVRELLFNVVKHARADAAIVTMDRTPSGLVKIAVADRGRGFDSSESSPDQSLEPCLGLFSIRGRLMSLGGRLEVESAAGRGTRVALYAPLRG